MQDYISAADAETLPGLFQQRVKRAPEAPAYMFFDALNDIWTQISWITMHFEIQRWATALGREKLAPGDRVAIMARNSRYWVMFDQAALALGLVVIPLYTDDRVDNVAYILADAEVKLLVAGGAAQWQRLKSLPPRSKHLKRIVSIGDVPEGDDKRLRLLRNWLPQQAAPLELPRLDGDALATIIYTSGTTGRPKGVMLSHKNILTNAQSCLQAVPIETQHILLSFLPLSHAFERTVGYYLAIMAGACVAHARSIPELAHDLLVIKPHVLISVPRIYERIYARIRESLQSKSPLQQYVFQLAVEVGWHKFEVAQGRARRHPRLLIWWLLKRLVAEQVIARLGGRLVLAISGGAALSPEISKLFIGLGLPVLQGYGLTETSPVISVNRRQHNLPASVGSPVDGVEVRINDEDELHVRGENVMLGYWHDQEATDRIIDTAGWLSTGDQAKLVDGQIYITGRTKDIIVLATGEKVSPADMELAIITDEVFEQVMVVGEARPYLTALAVLNEAAMQAALVKDDLDLPDLQAGQLQQWLLQRMAERLHNFPGYAVVHGISITPQPWTVEQGLLTPTLKIKRRQLEEVSAEQIAQMYAGH